jgi:hypothetical protein
MTVAIIVAVVAVVVGIVMLSRHKEGLGALFIVAGVVAAVLAMVARPR